MAQSGNHRTAIVIGAGIAGIKAAVDLNAKGIETLVLEARDRIGGRIHTYKSPSTGRSYDIGASWFHEVGFNPLFKKSLKEKSISHFFDDNSASIIGPDGEIPPTYKLGQVVDEMKLYASKETDQSINLHTLSNEYIVANKEILSEEQIKYAPQLLRMSEIMAGSWDMSNGSKANAPYGGRDAFVLSHYDSVIANELKDFPAENIKLSLPVQKVEKGSVITLTTASGEIYTCDYLVVTIPQSVIKQSAPAKGAIEWSPSLPKTITGNFDKLATVSLAKVVFEFDSCFWPKDTEKFIFIGQPDAQFSAKVLQGDLQAAERISTVAFNQAAAGYVPKSWDFPFLCVNLQAVKGVPTLLCLVPSPVSIFVENADTSAIWAIFKPLFATLGHVQDPVNVFTTHWNDDPYSQGAVSAVKPDGLFVNDGFIDGWDNVRFAGEHAIYEGHGCVHGAWMSGQREANYIINSLK